MTDFNGVTPPGRLISEAIFAPTTKGYKNREIAPSYYAQVAIPKVTPGLQGLLDDIHGAATEAWPQGESQQPGFSWKYKDGDLPENAARDGWAGCFVFTFRSGFAPQHIVDENRDPIIDKNRVKPGYQVRVAYSVTGNNTGKNPPETSGIYLNLNMVQLVAIDALIIAGPSAMEVFGSDVQTNPLQPDALAVPVQAPPYAPPVNQAPHTPAAPVQAPPYVPPVPPQQAPQGIYGLTPEIQPDPTFLQGPAKIPGKP